MSLIICGPKFSLCYAIISVWGVIMLGLLGVFFYVQSPALVDDLPIDEEVWAKKGEDHSYEYIKELYRENAINCWIAAAMYLVTFIISVVMYHANLRASHPCTSVNNPHT